MTDEVKPSPQTRFANERAPSQNQRVLSFRALARLNARALLELDKTATLTDDTRTRLEEALVNGR